MGFSSRESRLAQRVREGEDRIQWLGLQLANTQRKLHKVAEPRCEDRGSPPPCQTIQVAVVCAGAEASRTVITLIKSILFYR